MKSSSQTHKVTEKGDLLLSAILRTSQTRTPNFKNKFQVDKNIECSEASFNLISSINKLDLKPEVKPGTTTDAGSGGRKRLHERTKPSSTNEKKINQNNVTFPPVGELQIPTKPDVKKESSCCFSDTSATALSSNCQPTRDQPQDKKSSSREKTSGLLCSVVDRFRTKQCLKKEEDKCSEEDITLEIVESFKQFDLNKGVEVRFFKSVISFIY